MSKKYVYLATTCGFNDMLGVIFNHMQYCKQFGRILLIDGRKSLYKVNLFDYFTIDIDPTVEVIYDSDVIEQILADNDVSSSVYPSFVDIKTVMECNHTPDLFAFANQGYVYTKTGELISSIPNSRLEENVIVACACGGGSGFTFFSKWKVKDVRIKEYCKQRYNAIGERYASIQVRNTDRKCNYRSLYEIFKNVLHSFPAIYIATDDEMVLPFFKSKGLNVFNFTTFPKNTTNEISLHETTQVSPQIKLQDMLCDLYLMALSERIVSMSAGGFINLARDMQNRKDITLNQF
jgi:hypothetical protein